MKEGACFPSKLMGQSDLWEKGGRGRGWEEGSCIKVQAERATLGVLGGQGSGLIWHGLL